MRMSFDLDEFLPYQLSVAAAKISRSFAEIYRAEAGLTIPEWRVMAHLHRSGPVSVRDITARVHLDKSIVSRAASKLEGGGLISSQPHETDRRLVVLELTPEGKALMRRLGRIADDFQARLLRDLGPDAAPLQSALRRIIDGVP
ncbi:MarR family winged helix-turn-helix transcriptional regulator [Paracoccus sp. PARArs4]|uniref:MarR family winged helix-turn-helix transcriptional regulator n=1 Tax=Paracoccus sp. PARArs4 TaxID=2853442 RepID=UPI0024A6AF5D|nr:MarR family winged helix-turn-helix transcriptional regulator [Paracoccus sp. PARArs4]